MKYFTSFVVAWLLLLVCLCTENLRHYSFLCIAAIIIIVFMHNAQDGKSPL